MGRVVEIEPAMLASRNPAGQAPGMFPAPCGVRRSHRRFPSHADRIAADDRPGTVSLGGTGGASCGHSMNIDCHGGPRRRGLASLARSYRTVNARRLQTRAVGWLAAAVFLAGALSPFAAGFLENEALRVEFGDAGLAGIEDKSSHRTVRLDADGFAAFAGNEAVESDFLVPALEKESATNRVYRFQMGPWTARVMYELQPGWRFVGKQVALAHSGPKDLRVQRLEMFRGRIGTPVASDRRVRDAALLRFADAPSGEPTHGLFVALQNPFLQWKRQGQRLSAAYAPDLSWTPTNGMYVSDRLLLGPYSLSGFRSPARMVPEWQRLDTTEAVRMADGWIDRAEVDALVACVRAFLLWRPTRTTRVNVGWCENDYQIDIGTAEGRTEYRRIIDQAAAIGCRDVLFAPANSEVSALDQNRDAWGWENLLWFSLGQKLRRGEWDPARDPLPGSVKELVDYARTKDVRFLAYVYPSLPFLQRKEWTGWVPGGQPGGYLGADTGQASFQDWLLDQLTAFHRSTGAGGFAFDHWWIAYEETPSSKYAQWAGCRRVLEELRRRVPDALIDGRQQYHHFGVWTWLAGTYPHPLASDEQPESFRAFPDLHWSRVSADRQRRTAYWYRTECFVPSEIMPGYMTHQTPRLTEKGECPRGRFRAADWDLLGWKYSVISSIATAPFNLVVNFIPARDEREFRAFSEADRKWFRDWFDWTDRNLEILRHVRPILGAPQLGRVDGTAAFRDGHGFVFLFNPNYRALPAEFRLDASIGLGAGDRFLIRQLYPEGRLEHWLTPPVAGFWSRGERVSLDLPGTTALVLEVTPAPTKIEHPWLLGAPGSGVLVGEKLELGNVLGEMGTEQTIRVLVPEGRKVSSVVAGDLELPFRQEEAVVSVKVRFQGESFATRQPVGPYDPSFAGGLLRATNTIPARVFRQLEQRRRDWPVDYTADERAAPWLNSDRLLLFIQVAEPDDETMKDVTLQVDGQPIPVRPAYSSIVRSNPRNTFVGWYADVTALTPDVEHAFEVTLPKLAPGQFQGLFFDTVEATYTSDVAGAR